MPAKENETTNNETRRPEPQEQLVETQHTVTIRGQEISYTATAGTIILKEEEEKDDKAEGEKAKAAVFFVAYTRDGHYQPHDRPVTFSFNGGPGSSSVWLHLGLLGPRRVLLDEIGRPLPPPYQLVDNDYSLLDVTDLVFIDPVSTGFSRVVPGEKSKQFHDFNKDIESVGEFIRLYTSRARRWTSPKFLIGESYGTTRAAGLAGYLQDRHGLYLNGIMLVSAILNFQTARFTVGNDLPYILFLPTYTATAWYHRRLPAGLQHDLRQTLAEVEAFALGEYTLALMKGAALPAGERETIAGKLARYTGLSPEYVERSNLRIEIFRFVKELLRDQRRTTGRLDSRFTGVDRDAAGENFEYDPSYAAIQGAYTATLNDYLRRELQFASDLPYEILTDRVHPWKFDKHQNEYVNVAETLRRAMSMNPFLKLFVANGYYDLATPYLATEYTFNHLELDPALQQNISMGYYEAGHMMYIHRPSLAQLRQDLVGFIGSAVPESSGSSAKSPA
ncbi:MAG: peptidase S10 [Chloroflexi bacterium]|nr:peptidase S10 [Chloroflexota bacterium]MCI0575746.1 peptidase S10 [Chloroflexota bacterium]MCI0643647.1 peptidase S10 [Chloroflexota bacterium]MCI0729812.1 peptidase S10 [Chloroflexota bacterium]